MRRLRAPVVKTAGIGRDRQSYRNRDFRTRISRGNKGRSSIVPTLQDAGVERARALVAAIDDSNANIQIAIVASQLAPDLRVVVRVGDEMYEALARRAGADEVVIPEVISGTRVTEGLA